ncbi:hypothetical protein TNCV_2474291 [Trichonephila clavipes]|nr:hypothetical protein TNCV_2474291 [Trichonephila clavipes]
MRLIKNLKIVLNEKAFEKSKLQRGESCSFGIVVREADCGAVGGGFESRDGHKSILRSLRRSQPFIVLVNQKLSESMVSDSGFSDWCE